MVETASSREMLSVIIPISERHDPIETLYSRYRDALAGSGAREFIFVLDGEFPQAASALERLQSAGEPIRIVKLARWFGEATALMAGFERARGDVLLTLPAYEQVDAGAIPSILAALEDCDMAIGRRWPRLDSRLNRVQSAVFHGILKLITESDFHDLGCGVRALRRRVIDEIPLYGDQHRFFPLLARRRGFRVREVEAPQAAADRHTRLYRPGVYSRRLLDILTIFFLVKFTKKPLRFFGLIGSGLAAVGGVALLWVVIERLWFGQDLAERPALLLSALMVVLGVQILALGLIGELIIFTHAKDIKEYTVEEIVHYPETEPAAKRSERGL